MSREMCLIVPRLMSASWCERVIVNPFDREMALDKNIRKTVMSKIPSKRHSDFTVSSAPPMAAEELPMIQENSGQSCGGNLGRETRGFNNISVKRQGVFWSTTVEMNMNEHS